MNEVGPSPVLTQFVTDLQEVLDDSQMELLAKYRAGIAKSTDKNEYQRAHRCASWAVEILSTGKTSSDHPLFKRLAAVIEEVKNTLESAQYGRISSEGPIKIEVQTGWVKDAVDAAKEVADRSSWKDVPWEALLVELIGMES